ncbi:MAG TPA: FAD-dependent oxidoreductase, partial [Hyphomicrobiales bacterium]|nr:FAD-dependent oxidoreductase [Hyphomicrobiales bacterium]
VVTRRLFDHDKSYFFQGTDGRIIFAIPYEEDFTLIGTTDQDHGDPNEKPVCTEAEVDYLCTFASKYFKHRVTPSDVVWTYSGVRPLYDDGATSATAATREYVLRLNEDGAPLLSVFGGKITTHRRLAEAAMKRLAGIFPDAGEAWTAGVALPGGDFPVTGALALAEKLSRDYPFLDANWSRRLVKTYGTEARALIGDASSSADLGRQFGATITARELDWAVRKEWVRTGEDFLWRRTKLGLKLDLDAAGEVGDWIAARIAAVPLDTGRTA